MKARTVAEVLEAWRLQDPPISQENLARIAGVTSKTGHRWCNGFGSPDPEQIRLLEKHRPGLVGVLFPDAVKGKG